MSFNVILKFGKFGYLFFLFFYLNLKFFRRNIFGLFRDFFSILLDKIKINIFALLLVKLVVFQVEINYFAFFKEVPLVVVFLHNLGEPWV